MNMPGPSDGARLRTEEVREASERCVEVFPGYGFVHAILPTKYYRVVWIAGVKTFVTCGDAPVAVDVCIIDYLRGREDSDGVIRCNVGPVEKSPLQRETSVELPNRWVRQA